MAVACGIASALLMSTSAAAEDPDLAAIDRYVDSEIDPQRIPGLALSIVHGDRIAPAQASDRRRVGRAVTSQTPFLLGSVTRWFTALTIMGDPN